MNESSICVRQNFRANDMSFITLVQIYSFSSKVLNYLVYLFGILFSHFSNMYRVI